MSTPEIDQAHAHRLFSAGCFNACWDLLDKEVRTADEDATMLSLAHASLWHWTRREDVTNQSLSIGYWQVSRVYAVLGEAGMARRYGELCVKVSQNEAPFYLGYANEACARAAAAGGDADEAKRHLALAAETAKMVEKADDREALEKDLEEVALMLK